jgi:Domain of unknown function (DUF222)/HNH endonuclease
MDRVARVKAAVAELVAADPGEWSLDELGQAIPDLAQIANQLLAGQYQVLAAFDARGGAQIAGDRSTGEWLTGATKMSRHHAGGMVATARALRDDLPGTAAVLAAGQVTGEQVRAIRRAQRAFGEDFAAIEAILAAAAVDMDIDTLRTTIDVAIQNYTPDGYDLSAEELREKRRLHLSTGLDGWWHLSGMLDADTGAALAAAFDVFAATTTDDDRRSLAQRRVDALAEIAARAGETTDRPTGLGHLSLTLTADQLDTGLGVTWPSGLLMSRTDVAVQACTAELTLVVGLPTDDPVRWAPLAVGFAARYASPAQRAALAARDGNGCAHPGCTVPAWRCVAHHIRHWSDGGPTDISNMVLLCRYHHRRVHHGRLAVVWQDTHYTTQQPQRAPPTPLPA